LDNEDEERSTQKAIDLFLVMRSLDRAVQVRPTRISGKLFHSAVTLLSRMSVFRIADHELPEIFEVMSSIEAAARAPKEDNAVLIAELRAMGFMPKFQELSKRILSRPQYRYEEDFWETPKHIEKQARAVTDYLKRTTRHSCEVIFASVAP
jgi:hypothetical protein